MLLKIIPKQVPVALPDSRIADEQKTLATRFRLSSFFDKVKREGAIKLDIVYFPTPLS